MNQSLPEISQALESLIKDPQAQVWTAVETGYDETGMVATADGYLRLAKALVDFVTAAQNGECETWSFGEVQAPGIAPSVRFSVRFPMSSWIRPYWCPPKPRPNK